MICCFHFYFHFSLTRPFCPAEPPKIAPAHHFQFTPQPGTAWFLDGSVDGHTWGLQAGPFFATGAPVHHFQPRGTEKQFRLRYVNPATIGHAPVVLSGTSVAMEKAGFVAAVYDGVNAATERARGLGG